MKKPKTAKRPKNQWWKKLVKRDSSTTISGEDFDLLGQKGHKSNKDYYTPAVVVRRDMGDLL